MHFLCTQIQSDKVCYTHRVGPSWCLPFAGPSRTCTLQSCRHPPSCIPVPPGLPSCEQAAAAWSWSQAFGHFGECAKHLANVAGRRRHLQRRRDLRGTAVRSRNCQTRGLRDASSPAQRHHGVVPGRTRRAVRTLAKRTRARAYPHARATSGLARHTRARAYPHVRATSGLPTTYLGGFCQRRGLLFRNRCPFPILHVSSLGFEHAPGRLCDNLKV